MEKQKERRENGEDLDALIQKYNRELLQYSSLANGKAPPRQAADKSCLPTATKKEKFLAPPSSPTEPEEAAVPLSNVEESQAPSSSTTEPEEAASPLSNGEESQAPSSSTTEPKEAASPLSNAEESQAPSSSTTEPKEAAAPLSNGEESQAPSSSTTEPEEAAAPLSNGEESQELSLAPPAPALFPDEFPSSVPDPYPIPSNGYDPPVPNGEDDSLFPPTNPSDTDIGSLIVETFTARQALPVAEADVTVSHIVNGKRILQAFLQTDRDGLTPVIELSAPDRTLSESPGNPNPYGVYDIRVDHPEFYTVILKEVQVFGGVTSNVPVEMIPISSTELPQEPVEEYSVGQHALNETNN